MTLAQGCRKIRSRLLGRLEGAWPRESLTAEPPLRAELFSVEQMAQHGRVLAEAHRLADGRARPDGLLARLDDNEHTLLEVCRLLTCAVADKQRVVPAGEYIQQGGLPGAVGSDYTHSVTAVDVKGHSVQDHVDSICFCKVSC